MCIRDSLTNENGDKNIPDDQEMSFGLESSSAASATDLCDLAEICNMSWKKKLAVREVTEVKSVRCNWFFNIQHVSSILQWKISVCNLHYCGMKMLLTRHTAMCFFVQITHLIPQEQFSINEIWGLPPCTPNIRAPGGVTTFLEAYIQQEVSR